MCVVPHGLPADHVTRIHTRKVNIFAPFLPKTQTVALKRVEGVRTAVIAALDVGGPCLVKATAHFSQLVQEIKRYSISFIENLLTWPV